MEGFGQALRRQRQAAGMRQLDLVEALGHVIARSTLANVEVGREKPSARLWQAIQTHLPSWEAALEPWYIASHRQDSDPLDELAGPFEILSATTVYTFRDHRSPEEMIQVRQVRATQDGADGYGLQLGNLTGDFHLDTEPLWGGWIAHHERHRSDGLNSLLTRFHFDRTLALGQVHEFATRGWVSHDDPTTAATMVFTLPTRKACLVLNFLGPRPALVWKFCLPRPTDPAPTAPTHRAQLVETTPNGSCCLPVEQPLSGQVHGLAWQW